MKKLLCFGFLLLVVGAISAQNMETEIFRSYFKMEKRSVIAEYMDLEQDMEIPFWTIYDEYESKRSKLAIERIALIRDVNAKVNSIDDQMAANWITLATDRLEEEEKLRKKYILMLSNATNPIVALKFAQFDQYFNAVINYQLYQQLIQINTNR